MGCGETFLIGFIALIVVGAISSIKENRDKAKDKAENQSDSADYVYKRDENSSEFGGTNLDRFFVECVLSGCTDFSLEKNRQKAQLFANKYNLNFPKGIESLFDEARNAHNSISKSINSERLSKLRRSEQDEFALLNKYSNLTGIAKRETMLKDLKRELENKSSKVSAQADYLMKRDQIREKDWATLGGIADGIAGPAAGLATAIDIQRDNEAIRAHNEAAMRRNMPLYSAVMDKSYDYKKQARTLDEYIAKIPETLVGNEDSSEVFNKLKIAFDGISVSETGAFKIYATVDTVEKLLIYDDLDAVADGTVVAKVYDGERLVGTANLVFPMEGVQGETKLCGMGLSGCKENSDYKVKFTPKNLWLMEKM